MQGRNKIRWKRGERDELAKQITSFNRRRNYAIKKNPELKNLIPRLNYNKIVSQIKTRADLNRFKKELKWSRAKNAFTTTKIDNVTVTKWEMRKAKSRLQEVNRKRKKERERVGASTTKGTMGSIEQNNLTERSIPKIKSLGQWKRFVETIEFQSRDDYYDWKNRTYTENYLQAWENVFRDYRLNDMRAVANKLGYYHIAQGQFYSPILNIDFIYVQDDLEIPDKVETILSTWYEYADSVDIIL